MADKSPETKAELNQVITVNDEIFAIVSAGMDKIWRLEKAALNDAALGELLALADEDFLNRYGKPQSNPSIVPL